MAEDVWSLITDGGALACEAGTGTGKTIAYVADEDGDDVPDMASAKLLIGLGPAQ